MKYNRILLKLSGEALLGKNLYGIDNDRLVVYAKEIKQIHEQGVEIAIVIGGGNIFRGLTGSEDGIDRVQADYMGMLATVINGLALQNALEKVFQLNYDLVKIWTFGTVCPAFEKKTFLLLTT